MTPITIQIGGDQFAVNYDAIPTSVDPAAIGVSTSTYVGPYGIVDNSSFRLSLDQGLAGIPAQFLAQGHDYLVFYSCAQGMSNDQNFPTVQSQVYAFVGDATDVSGSTPPTASYGKARTRPIMRGSATPFHMRGCGLSGFALFTAPGNKPFQFAMQNVSGKLTPAGTGDHNTAWFGGMSIVSIPLASLTLGTDYWYAKDSTQDLLADGGGITLGTALVTGTYFDIINLTFTVPESGTYLVMATMTGGTNNGGSTTRARLTENVSTIWQQDTHIVQANEHRNYVFQKNRTYVKDQVISLTLRGEIGVSGAQTQKYYFQPRILVMRLNTFKEWSVGTDNTLGLDEPVVSDYPLYEEASRSTITPSLTENVLILGQCGLYRTSVGSQLAHIVDYWDGSLPHEFSAYTNIDGTNADRNGIFCVAAPIINFQHTYALQVVSEPGQSANLFFNAPTMTVIGLTRSNAISNSSQTLTIDETSGGSDARVITSFNGGANVEGVSLDDISPNPMSDETISLAYTPAASGITSAHPRLWVYNNSRLQYMKDNSSIGTPSSKWTAWMNMISGSSLQESWQYTLKYLVTGDSTDKTNALNKMFGAGGMMSQNMAWMLGQDDGLYTRFPFRCMSLMLDWMYNDLTQPQRDLLSNAMLAIAYTLLNPTDSATIYADTGYNSAYHGWAIYNPFNNHYYQQRLGIAYAALSMYGAQPTTFTWKSGAASGWIGAGTTQYNFRLPRDNGDGTVTYYSDLWLWLKDQIDTKMLPILDVSMAGGFSVEGTQYGKNSVKHMLEMFSIIRQTAGLDYMNSHQVMSDHGYYHLYAMVPMATDAPATAGYGFLSNQGDQSTDQRAQLRNDDRYLSLMAADALTGYPLANHQQFWMNTYYPAMLSHYGSNAVDLVKDSVTFEPYDFLLYNANRAAIDYTDAAGVAPLPTHYFAPGVGFWTSRSDWTASAMQVFLKGGSRQNEDHGHSDFAALEIFLGPGTTECWLTADANFYAPGPQNNAWSEDFVHSTYQIVTPDFPTGWRQHRFGNVIPVAREPITVGGGGGGGGGAWDGGASTTVTIDENFVARQIFPTNNWWNKDISAWPVDPNSATIIANQMTVSSAGNPAGSFWPDWGADPYGIPYIGVGGGQALVPVTFNGGPGYSDASDAGQPGRPTGYPIPTQAITQRGYLEQGDPGNVQILGVDRHLLLIDRDNGFGYELYKALYTGGQWTASNGACFQFTTNNRRPEGWTSASAGGLCIFAGLVTYDEVFGANPITHATRVSIRYSDGTHVYPASHNSNNDVAQHNSLFGYPMGMRLRLKAAIDTTALVNSVALSAADRNGMKQLFDSWKKYGLIVDDRGGNGFVQGTMDSRWVSGAYNALFKNHVFFNMFDVITLGYDA